MTDILKQTRYHIVAEGSLVKIQLGDIPITMDYNTALAIAQDLRIVAKQAKANAGDTSRNIKARGLLTDANADEKRRDALRDPTAAFH